jgi:septum formation protein
MKQKIILASSSPRRHSLMEQIGLEFEVIPSRYEEDLKIRHRPSRTVMDLAQGKAEEVVSRVKKGIVIGADCIVVLGMRKLGKPKDRDDARRMLKRISGRTVKVYSGIAIIDARTGKNLVDYEVTRVKMRRMSAEDIDRYVATGEPLDKAGAFAIQGLGAIFVSEIKGCYHNVMGLPVYNLAKNLKKFGVNIFAYEKWTNYIR